MTTWYGEGIDIPLKLGDNLKTSTSQYLVCGIQGETTSADLTAYLCNAGATLEDTTTARNAICVNMSNMLSSGSEVGTFRLAGTVKVICSASIAAGDWYRAYEGASTTTRRGQIQAIVADSCSSYGQTTTSFITVLGKVLRDGSTNSVVEATFFPQLYDLNLITEA